MTDGHMLLAAIIAQPDEDTPRLAYADWLQENGHARRAEFIRLQCAYAAGTPPSPMGLWDLLHHAEGWFDAACKPLRLAWDNWGVMHDGTVHYESKRHGNQFFVRRGFVESVTCLARDWVYAGDRVRAAHPVRLVRLTSIPEIDRHTTGPSANTFMDVYIVRGDFTKVPDGRVFEELHRERNEFMAQLDPGDNETARAVLRARWPGARFYLPGDPDDAHLAAMAKWAADQRTPA